MIVLIEEQCRGWEHEWVNSSFVKLVLETLTEEKIAVYADGKHIECIKEKEDFDYANLEFQPLEFAFDRNNREDTAGWYKTFIDDLVKKYPDQISDIIFLSVNLPIISAVKNYNEKTKSVKIHFILHSILESALRRDFFHPDNELAEMLEQSMPENIDFITYAPYYQEYLKGHINQEVIEKTHYMHHTCRYSKKDHKNSTEKKKDKICVAVYGQALTDEAFKVIKYFNRNRYLNQKVEFMIIMPPNTLDIKGNKRHHQYV